MIKLVGAALVLGSMQGAYALDLKNMAPHRSGEILVKIKDGKLNAFLSEKSLSNVLVKEIIKTSFGQLALVKTTNKTNWENLLVELNEHADVEYAEPNFIYRAIGEKAPLATLLANAQVEYASAGTPNDPKFGLLWGLHNTGSNEPGSSKILGVAGADVNALRAWDITRGSKSVKIAVIDTGVDYTHPDLASNMWVNEAEQNGTAGVDDDGNGYVDDVHGMDFANNDGDPMDGHGHGTHCSGTIAAEHNNGVGVAGVMAHASIVAIKFLTDEGSGTTADAVKAIDYATKIEVDIMSNSWGGGGRSQALEDSIRAASDAGIVFTAAAGNSASNNNTSPHYPSNYPVKNVISVAAHNVSDALASFSCYGSKTVHVAAPGHNILSTTTGNNYEVYSGTSMATPHVTGVIGLYLSQNGRTDLETLKDRLMATSVYANGYGRKLLGEGRVDAYNLLTNIVPPKPARPNPNAWVSSYDQTLSSEHPYANNTTIKKTFSVPGAKYVRLVIKKFDIERSYDFLAIKNADGSLVEKIDGAGENMATEYVEGDTMAVEFSSDVTVNKWGFEILEVQSIH